MRKKVILISFIVFIISIISFSNEKNVSQAKFGFSFIDGSTSAGSVKSGISFYQTENQDYAKFKKNGIILASVGGGVLGLFYFLSILAGAVGWSVATVNPPPSTDRYYQAAAIGLAFLPVAGVLTNPGLFYLANTNDKNEVFTSSDQAISGAITAVSVLFFLFQLAGLSLIISGASLIGYSVSKSKNVSLLLDSYANFRTREEAVIAGVRYKF